MNTVASLISIALFSFSIGDFRKSSPAKSHYNHNNIKGYTFNERSSTDSAGRDSLSSRKYKSGIAPVESPLVITNTSLNSQSTSGETSVFFGDAASSVAMLRASKRTNNTRAFEIWTEYGYNVASKAADFYNHNINFYTSNINRFSINYAGLVGIGTTTPDEKLTVKGKIHAEEVKVDLNVAGPDYVFEKDYKLKSLVEIQRYISLNKHLPDVPSASEMEMNGINLSDMNMILLKKIEELTLHLINQDKRIKELERKQPIQ